MRNQVLDARNVWAPLGTLVQRPGYTAIAQYEPTEFLASNRANYVDGTTLYAGSDDIFYVILWTFNAVNTNAGCQYRYEYWNGTYWAALGNAYQYNSVTGVALPLYAQITNVATIFTPPSDWTTTTVNGLSRLWVRCVPAGAQSPSLTPTSAAGTLMYKFSTLSLSAFRTLGIGQFKYNRGTNFLVSTGASPTIAIYSTLRGGIETSSSYRVSLPSSAFALPLQSTVIPEFNLAYAAIDNVVNQVLNDNTIAAAAVNSDPLIVGPIASDPTIPYPADVIAQLPAFPQANLIINFRNLIFASGILGQPTLVRWSGSVNVGAYNVWPETSFETLSTASDNSPITAMAGLGDNLVVFKQDSIWQLVFKSLDDNDLPLFVPQLVVAGVGCVSQGSVQEIRGRLIFLAEDGFYAFDGTPNIKKLSEAINTTTQRINPSHRPFATAINWRSKYCYLCATALDESSANNIIFVYDYKHDAWWLWDDIPAEFLLVTSDTALEEQVIFGNQTAGFFKLIGETDNFGPIDSYILTGRFGEDEVLWKTAREIRVRSQNIDGSLSYYLYSDDQTLGETAKTIIMDSPDETQADESPPDGCDNVQPRRRERKAPQRELGQWYQLRVDGFKLLEGLDIGWIPESRR